MVRCGFVCKKLVMSQIFSEKGESIPVTILDASVNTVVSNTAKRGKSYVRLAAFDSKAHKLSKPVLGQFAKAKIAPKKIIKQFTVQGEDLKAGDELTASRFKIGQFVDITSKTIGKGFAGVMKRHNFKGLEATHGVSVKHRSAGSTGQCQDPGKVFKGKKMAGRLGGVNKTIQNIEVVDIDLELNLLVVRGSVPGKKGSYLTINDAIKK